MRIAIDARAFGKQLRGTTVCLLRRFPHGLRDPLHNFEIPAYVRALSIRHSFRGYRHALSAVSRSVSCWQAVGAEEFTGSEWGYIWDF